MGQNHRLFSVKTYLFPERDYIETTKPVSAMSVLYAYPHFSLVSENILSIYLILLTTSWTFIMNKNKTPDVFNYLLTT